MRCQNWITVMAEGGKKTLGYNPEGWAMDIPGEYSK